MKLHNLVRKYFAPSILGLTMALSSACGDGKEKENNSLRCFPPDTIEDIFTRFERRDEAVAGEYDVKVSERFYNLHLELVKDEERCEKIIVSTLGSEREVHVDFLKGHTYERNLDSGEIGDEWSEPLYYWGLEFKSSGTIGEGRIHLEQSYEAFYAWGINFSGRGDFYVEGKKHVEVKSKKQDEAK